jgi:predicted metal-dependent phosphoesterase TrpH
MPIADFHCHTVFSHDCCTSIPELVRRCRRAGIDCLAVTDHNEIEGALRVRDTAGFRVIVGEEIFTAGGEVIGLFLESCIPPRLPFRETLERIKAQGGLTYLPHPVSGIRKSRLSRAVVEANLDLLDVVETYNARTLLGDDDEARWVEALTRTHDLATAAASDAHSPWEVGTVRVALEDFTTPGELLQRLRAARVTARPVPLWMRGVLNHKVRGLLRTVTTHVTS